ncbi:MAG: LysM peptidoglycan-binding domain-containing protein [Myxococcales bacterium]|nr:LysM peptidoglycan-binding domain-containing protein [Myxococcales bacterium]
MRTGDTLAQIAKKAYGGAAQAKLIAAANKGKVGPRGQLKAGTTLYLPPRPGDGVDARRVVDQGKRKLLGDSKQAQGEAEVPVAQPALQQEVKKQITVAQLIESNTKLSSGGGVKLADIDARHDLGSSQRHWTKAEGWLDDKKDVADEAGKKPRVDLGISAHATLLARSAAVSASVASASGTTQLGNLGTASGQARVLYAGASGSAAVGVDLKKLTLKGDLSGRAEAHLADAEGTLKSTVYGNQVIHGQTQVSGRAFVGAEATGNATVSLGRDGVRVGAGVDAFVGAKASAEVKQTLGLGGHDVASVGARGEVYAGLGVKAQANVGFQGGRANVDINLGAAVGVGAGVRLNFDVDVFETGKLVGGAAMQVAGAAATAGQNIASGVSTARSAVAEGATAAFKKVTSFFW